MHESDQSFAYAFFGDEKRAAAGVQKLLEHGFDAAHIGVLMRERSGVRDVSLEHRTGIGPGAVLGGVLGATVGAAALPATGVISLGGAFATIGGAAVGGSAGALMGVLGGLGLWKKQLAVPTSAFEHGGVLVGALAAPERAERARAALREAGARDTKFATQTEAKHELTTMDTAPVRAAAGGVKPDKLARNVFLLSLTYVLVVIGSIWLFIRPV